MSESKIVSVNGEPAVLVEVDPTEPETGKPAETGGVHLIPLAAIASWSALLGTSDDEETIAAIMHVRENGEPAPDPETGRNAWTPAYEQLEMEVAAAAAAEEAEARASAQRISSAFARSRSKAASAGALNGREQTRSLLGLPSKGAAPAALSAAATEHDDSPGASRISLAAPLAEAAASAAEAVSGDGAQAEIASARERFLRGLRHEL